MTEIAFIGAQDVPYIAEAEQAVLGMCLLRPETIGAVVSAGGADLFHDPVHCDIFKQAADRERHGLSLSPVALSEWAKGNDAMTPLGGAGYLAKLAGFAPSARQVWDYVSILQDQKAKRDLLSAAQEATAAIRRGEQPAEAIAGQLEAALVSTQPTARAKPVTMHEAVMGATEQVVAAFNNEETQCVHSGIMAVDRIVSGFYPGDLILLGGRPSMGKTAVALSMALNVARAGHGVVICSLEMTPEAMALRAISEGTSRNRNAVTYSSLRKGDMSEAQSESFKKAARDVAELPITFLPREFSDIGALMAGAKQARRMLGDNMRLFIVDYAQLLTAKAANRYEEITKISLALKALAGQLNVPVLALSQLSRKLEERNDKRPMMSDLRESGQLEQDADTVMFCYRDEYYMEREEPDISDQKHEAWERSLEAARNRLEIIVAKQRQGAIGTAHVRCNPALNLIWE